MSRAVIFHPKAEAEFQCALGDYLAEDPDLGRLFDRELQRVVSMIEVDPLRWRERPEGFRRVNLKRFPFYLAYLVEDGVILAIAVAHTGRSARHLRERLP